MPDKEQVTPQQAEEMEQNTRPANAQETEKTDAKTNEAKCDKNEKAPAKTELEKLQDDYAALNDKYLRLMAEYDNFRKRSQRERDAVYPEATAAAAAAFLTVADNFERALAAECADPEYKKGTELTYQSLMDALGKLKVE